MSTWSKLNAGALAILLATVVGYFISLAVAPPGDEVAMIVRLVAASAIGIAVVIVAISALAVANRREAGQPQLVDERERRHGGQAARAAYPVALAGIIAVVVVMARGAAWTTILNTAIAVIALAEGVRLAVAVRLATRG